MPMDNLLISITCKLIRPSLNLHRNENIPEQKNLVEVMLLISEVTLRQIYPEDISFDNKKHIIILKAFSPLIN